jgi:Ca2+-binding RTX toxin-like protein
MANVHIGDQTSVYVANSANTNYILDFNDKISVSANGIFLAPAVAGRSFQIDGEISAHQVGMFIGLQEDKALPLTVDIGETGNIHGDVTAIYNASDASHLINAGSLVGEMRGIDSYGNTNHIDNSGLISGAFGVSITGDFNVLLNTGVITGTSAVYMDADGVDNSVINRGTLSGSVNAVLGSMQAERIVNFGRMYGDVSMSDGNDTFVSRGGFVSGYVRGGNGDDLYILGKGKIEIVEFNGGGVDTVRTAGTYTLADGLENLALTGNTAVNGTGNLLSNGLTGNAGNNHLSGGDGMDFLSGGHGKDWLTGGADADIFVFKSNSDREIVMDFKDGQDHIRFYGGNDVTSLSDLLAHHVEQVKGDLVIEANGTEMILKGIHAADLTSADFYTAQF